MHIDRVVELDKDRLPKHIAIIMDGNGRWAKQKGLPRALGHKAGVETLKEIVTACSDLGIKILTVYAFSTENWKRPKDEVGYLMNLLVEYMKKEINALHENRVRIKILGDINPLPTKTKKEINSALTLTRNNTGLQFNIALNYGGRAEILMACKALFCHIQNGKLAIEDLNEKNFSDLLFTGCDLDPDLIIRTSGEQRLSNFLLWQSAYSEFIFPEELWPDFKKENLIKALYEYQTRDRRFGALK